MPNISISLPLTDGLLNYELAPDFTIGDLKGLISADTELSVESQWLVFNGRPLENDAQTLQDAGIKDHDFVICTQKQPQSRAPAPGPAQLSEQEERGIEQERQRLLGQSQNTQVREYWQKNDPELLAAVNDPARFRTYLLDLRRKRIEEIESLNNDWTEENQAKIYEEIRQKNVEEQREQIQEENPELFGSVTMLYIDAFINGHPVKAFVDSGAQTTVMSPGCAEACEITHLIDKRYQGMAVGVGTAQIIGRVHRASMRIGDADDLPCSFTVMEGKTVDLLFGLDMLKRYQASIDLKNNRLVLGDGSISVPFLPESEIPKPDRDEPKLPGPDGTAIGAKSGTVVPAPPGSAAAASAAASASSAPQPSKAPAASTSASASASTSTSTPRNFQGQGHTLGSSSSAASAAAAPAQAQAQPAPRAPAQPEFAESDITILQGIGATREQAIAALQACDGNVDYAAAMLFDA